MLTSTDRRSAAVLRVWQVCNTFGGMKSLTVRLSDKVAAELEAESRARKISKSDIVRESLDKAKRSAPEIPQSYRDIADLIGSVDGLPTDLAARKKHYLKTTGYGRKRPR